MTARNCETTRLFGSRKIGVGRHNERHDIMEILEENRRNKDPSCGARQERGMDKVGKVWNNNTVQVRIRPLQQMMVALQLGLLLLISYNLGSTVLIVRQVESFTWFGFGTNTVHKQPHQQISKQQKQQSLRSHYAFKLKREYSDKQDDDGSRKSGTANDNNNNKDSLQDTMTMMSSLSPADVTSAMKDLEEQLDEQDEWLKNQQLMLDRIADDDTIGNNGGYDNTRASAATVAKANQQYSFMPDASEGISGGGGTATLTSNGSNGYQNGSSSKSSPSPSEKESEDPYDMDRRAEPLNYDKSNNDDTDKTKISKPIVLEESEDPFEMGRAAAKEFLKTMKEQEDEEVSTSEAKTTTEEEEPNTVVIGNQEILIENDDRETEGNVLAQDLQSIADELMKDDGVKSQEKELVLAAEPKEEEKEIEEEKNKVFVVGNNQEVVILDNKKLEEETEDSEELTDQDKQQEKEPAVLWSTLEEEKNESKEEEPRIFVVGDQQVVLEDSSLEQAKEKKETSSDDLSSITEEEKLTAKVDPELEEDAKETIVEEILAIESNKQDSEDAEVKNLILPDEPSLSQEKVMEEKKDIILPGGVMMTSTMEQESSPELVLSEEEAITPLSSTKQPAEEKIGLQTEQEPELNVEPKSASTFEQEDKQLTEPDAEPAPEVEIQLESEAEKEKMEADPIISEKDEPVAFVTPVVEEETKEEPPVDSSTTSAVLLDKEMSSNLVFLEEVPTEEREGEKSIINEDKQVEQDVGGTIEDVLAKILERKKKEVDPDEVLPSVDGLAGVPEISADNTIEIETELQSPSSSPLEDEIISSNIVTTNAEQPPEESVVLEEATFDDQIEGEGDDLFWDEGEEEAEEVAASETNYEVIDNIATTTAAVDTKTQSQEEAEVAVVSDNSKTADANPEETVLTMQDEDDAMTFTLDDNLMDNAMGEVNDEQEIEEPVAEIFETDKETPKEEDKKENYELEEYSQKKDLMKELLLTVAEHQQEEERTILTPGLDEIEEEEEEKLNVVKSVSETREEAEEEEGEKEEDLLKSVVQAETEATPTKEDEEKEEEEAIITDASTPAKDEEIEEAVEKELFTAAAVTTTSPSLTTVRTATVATAVPSTATFIRTTTPPRTTITLEQRFKAFSGSAKQVSDNVIKVLSPNLSIQELSELERSKLLKTAGVELTKSMLSTSRAAVLGIEAFVDVLGNNDSAANDNLKQSTVQMIQSYQILGDALAQRISSMKETGKKERNDVPDKNKDAVDIGEQFKGALDATSKSWNTLVEQLDKSNAKRKASEALEETTKSLSTSTIALGAWGIRSVVDGIKSIQTSIQQSQQLERMERQRVLDERRERDENQKVQDETDDMIRRYKLEASKRLLEQKKDTLQKDTEALQYETAQLIEKTKARSTTTAIPVEEKATTNADNDLDEQESTSTNTAPVAETLDQDTTSSSGNADPTADSSRTTVIDDASFHPFLPEVVAEQEEADYLELEHLDDYESSSTSLPANASTLHAETAETATQTKEEEAREKETLSLQKKTEQTAKDSVPKEEQPPKSSTTEEEEDGNIRKPLPFFARRAVDQ